MLQEKPFIHLFKTPYGFYFFDVNKNVVIKVNEPLYKYLCSEQIQNVPTGICLDQREIGTLERLKREGFLSSRRVKEVIHSEDEVLEFHLTNKLQKITLQVTQQCNFRCSYCIYSNSSNEMQRGHSNRRMNVKTAIKCIDFLNNHSGDSQRVNIGFYGGEPLLEFDLIKECIEYSKSKIKGKECTYNITTNATLITEDIIRYFEENDVALTISLDGPEDIHNKNRRFSNNGKGSFTKVIEKLLMIKNLFPNYYNDKVGFNAVIDPEEDFGAISKFFNNELFRNGIFTTTVMNDAYSVEKVNFTEDYIIKRNYELFKAYLSVLGKIDKRNVSRIAMTQYSELNTKAKELKRSYDLPDKACHGGPCIPGKIRLFVDTDGNFFPCERVSEASEIMKIGHIDSGFEFERIRELLNIGKLTEEECKNCWVFRHCTLCANSADNNKCLSGDLKKTNCKNVVSALESTIKDYIALKELGHSFN